MGCSSGLLQRAGAFEPTGIAISYILSGWYIHFSGIDLRLSSPALVANLWDVTDKDTDAYTEVLLQNWFTAMKEKPLSQVASSSRSVCKLTYLNGAAPICYGVPVYLSNPPRGWQNTPTIANALTKGTSKTKSLPSQTVSRNDNSEEKPVSKQAAKKGSATSTRRTKRQ
jgi:hypothetical protein